jgi:hypothetical protein
MAYTQLSICNLAILELGAAELGESIANIDSTTDPVARRCKAIWEPVLLDIFDLPVKWKFARARAQLVLIADYPVFGKYEYAYALPSDCREILAMIDENDDDLEYEYSQEVYVNGATQTDCILTNEEECRIRYKVYRPTPTYWPAWFVRLVELKLAIQLGNSLTGQQEKVERLKRDFMLAYDNAKISNAALDNQVYGDGVNTDKGNTNIIDAAQDGL